YGQWSQCDDSNHEGTATPRARDEGAVTDDQSEIEYAVGTRHKEEIRVALPHRDYQNIPDQEPVSQEKPTIKNDGEDKAGFQAREQPEGQGAARQKYRRHHRTRQENKQAEGAEPPGV